MHTEEEQKKHKLAIIVTVIVTALLGVLWFFSLIIPGFNMSSTGIAIDEGRERRSDPNQQTSIGEIVDSFGDVGSEAGPLVLDFPEPVILQEQTLGADPTTVLPQGANEEVTDSVDTDLTEEMQPQIEEEIQE